MAKSKPKSSEKDDDAKERNEVVDKVPDVSRNLSGNVRISQYV